MAAESALALAVGALGLPAAPEPFVGRRAELALLREELERPGLGGSAPGARVLAVAGRPGSGRTALALRLAAELDGFTRTAFLALDRPRPALRLLDALGLPRPGALSLDEAESTARASLREALAGGPVLLVLDEVADAAQMRALLPETAGSVVIAVTAGPLSSVPDVRPCVLGGLDYTAARELLAALAGDVRVVVDPVAAQALSEAVACHVGALRLLGGWLAARPRASVSDALRALREIPADVYGEPPAGHEPGSSVGLPGASGLGSGGPAVLPRGDGPASGGVAGSGPAGARAAGPVRLGLPGQTVPPLPGHAPDAAAAAAAPAPVPPVPPRGSQRGDDPLRRAFALVYGGLGPAAQQLLRLATVVPGGVLDARGAAALVGSPIEAAAALLANCAGQQLLREEAPGRYRLPSSLRPVLTGLREAVDKPSVVELAQARWLERQVRLLGSCLSRLVPDQAQPDHEIPPVPLRFRSAAEAWQWLDESAPTLLAAVDEAMARGGLDGLATRLATGLVRALPLRAEAHRSSAAAELYALHTAVEELARRGGQPRRQAAALVNLGDLHAAAGEHTRAMERYRSALTPARSAQDHVAVGRILEATAGAYRASGDLVRAADFYGRALTFRRNRGERGDEARLLSRLAATHSTQGRYADALREYRAAVALFRKLADETGAVGAILGAARVQELSGQTEAALRTQREALETARKVGARLEGTVLLRMAEAFDRAGDPSAAKVQREQAAALGVLPRPQPPRQPSA